jgi:hypothetical protein
MNRKVGYALDAFLIFCLIAFFYFHAFEKGEVASSPIANLHFANFVIVILSMFVLPFHLKNYPNLNRFINYDHSGNRRKTIAVPLFWMMLFLFGSLVAVRIVVKLFELPGVAK